MQQKLLRILANMKRYNAGSLSGQTFGLDSGVVYDVLVVAPAWKPTKILAGGAVHVTTLAEHSYLSGYLVEKDGLKIAWIQCASGACNLIDGLTVCAELQFKKLVFVGAVGSLSGDYQVGDFCTPSYSVAGVYANAYLCEKLSDYRLFEKVYPDPAFVARVAALAERRGYELKQAPVFCTDSISLEYSHLEEIKAFGASLIEMETSSFYLLARLFEVPAIALLAVSDNSATGDPLIGRDSALDEQYHHCRNSVIPDMICAIAKM